MWDWVKAIGEAFNEAAADVGTLTEPAERRERWEQAFAEMEELDSIRQVFVDQPEVDEEPHQIRTSQIIVRIEKVIELPKPDLAVVDPEGDLRPGLSEVPSCQHSLHDVNDGVPRANG